MKVYFHVTDECNMRCPGCHWFSEPVTVHASIHAEDIGNFLRRSVSNGLGIERVEFSGGEPTLWPELAAAINQVPAEISDVRVFSNGASYARLVDIRRHMMLRISIHNGVNWSSVQKCIEIAKIKEWNLRFVAYAGAVEKVSFPDWFTHQVSIRPEQVKAATNSLGHFVGRRVLCKPKKIYFATDGQAYYCEKGLRTKDERYSAGFSLWEGEPRIVSQACVADGFCLGNMLTEQDCAICE